MPRSPAGSLHGSRPGACAGGTASGAAARRRAVIRRARPIAPRAQRVAARATRRLRHLAWLGGGCHCARDTVGAVAAAGFAVERVRAFARTNMDVRESARRRRSPSHTDIAAHVDRALGCMTRDRDVEAMVPMDDELLLSTATTGRGRNPVVLCHGGVGRSEYLQPVAEALTAAARVHRWEQRGCGRSQRVGPYSIARYLHDLECLRRHFGHERWLVAGHSWGAGISPALRACAP
jgi:hypothetical protein